MLRRIIYADNLPVLEALPAASIPLIYVDPPFNTGKVQMRQTMQTASDPEGDRAGYGGRRYRTTLVGVSSFQDSFNGYLDFLEPRLREAHRVLSATGTLYFHIDYREAHYCKLLLDAIFGRRCFLNEIIWAYDYGGRPRRRWPPKHDTIFVYVKNPSRYTFNADEIQREPYMAPGLVGPEKARRGKLPTDVWWHTIVSPTGREKTGYPTQKPLGVLRRIITASSHPGEIVLDFFAGSGTTGMAAAELGRGFILVDNHREALIHMAARFADAPDIEWINFDPVA